MVSHLAEVAMVAITNVKQIDQLELASVFGGPIASTRGANGEPVPTTSQYPVWANLEGKAAGSGKAFVVDQPIAGVLLVQGDPESIMHRMFNKIVQVLIRESGF